MSYDERREKLFNMSAYSDQRVRNEEIGMVIRMLQQSWEQHRVLPMPDLSDIEEEDETQSEMVFEWTRNYKRSDAFCE